MPMYEVPLGVAYAVSMFIAGNVLIGIGDILTDLADNVDSSSVSLALQCLFLVRGIGQLIATPLAAELFRVFHGHGMLLTCLMMIMALWVVASWITYTWTLYIWFFATGLLTATLDTGTQMLTRRAYKAQAGPWLTANTMFFACAGLVSPLVSYVVPTTRDQTFVYAGFAALAGVLLWISCDNIFLWPKPLPDMDKKSLMEDANQESGERSSEVKPTQETNQLWAFFSKDYWREWLIAFVVFFVIGGQNVYSSYIITFMNHTGCLPSKQKDALLSMFWASTVVSRLLALMHQMFITTRGLFNQLVLLLSLAVASTASVYLIVTSIGSSNIEIWVSAIAYGGCTGPLLGYLFDIQNRLSTSSERGSAILIFGMNLGTSLIPWGFVFLWDIGASQWSFPISLTICPAISILLLMWLYVAAEEVHGTVLDKTKQDLVLDNIEPTRLEEDAGSMPNAPPPAYRWWNIQRSVTPAVLALYFILVTTFYLLSSSFPQMFAVQFDDDCNRQGYFCGHPTEDGGWTVLIWYCFLWALGLWGIARYASKDFRTVTERSIMIPLFNIHTSIREILLFTSVGVVAVLWWYLWWVQLAVKSSGIIDRFNYTLGHMNDLFISILLLMTARTSLWDFVLGVSYEQSIIYHEWTGTIAFIAVSLHLWIWWLLWLSKGTWLEMAVTRSDDPNVNLVTGEACTWKETLLATCGNGHFWVIPGLELWYFLMGVPALAIFAYYPIRRAHYQAFYYAHHQFLIFIPLAYYHSWGLWKYATIGLLLYITSRIVSRFRAHQQVNVKELKHAAPGIISLKLEKADNQPLWLQGPGMFVYLNIPAIDPLEWHPFSISSPPGLTTTWSHNIKAIFAKQITQREDESYHEWTEELYTLASNPHGPHPQVFYDGPYGVSAFKDAGSPYKDEVVFVAGGIGITNPLSYLLDYAQDAQTPILKDTLPKVIHLVWVVRHRHVIEAFVKDLELLKAFPDIFNIMLFETGTSTVDGERSPLLKEQGNGIIVNKDIAGITINKGRPDIPRILESICHKREGHLELTKGKKVIGVFVCGPSSLVDSVENACTREIMHHHTILYHAEAFAL